MSAHSHIPTDAASTGSTSAASLAEYICVVLSMFEPLAVRLQGATTLPARHATVVYAYTDSRPAADCDVDFELPGWSVDQLRLSDPEIVTAYQLAVTARTLST